MTHPRSRNVFTLGLLALVLTSAPAKRMRAQGNVLTPVPLRASAPTNTVRYDFGAVSLLDEPQLVHTFRLRNDGLAPLTLTSLTPSCHCTTATVEPDGALPTLAPGRQVSVRVSIVTEPYLTGPLLKSVAVYAEGVTAPVATLEMAATLRPSVTWTPTALDFGTVPAGQSRSAIVTASMDSRLLTDDRAPRLIASDPDIRIVPLPAGGAMTGPTPTFRTLAYRVTLPADATLGTVHDLLRFASPGPADGPTVPVDGRVAGAATVTPAMLAFGGVRRGHSAMLPLRLDARRAGLWRSTRIVTDHPWVTVRLTPGHSSHRTLKVMVTPTAPAGSMQAQVTVTLANGQRLRVPVTAYITTSRLP